ncbi:unnamed protein product, partial [Leptidea sinapis]
MNGTNERKGPSLQSSPVRVSSSPVRASPSPVHASSSPVRASSPLKSSISPVGKQRSPRKCQFSFNEDSNSFKEKCGSSWLCRRGAGVDGDTTRVETPGPSVSLPQGCEDAAPPPKNCFRLVMLGSARVGKTSLVARFLGTKFEDSDLFVLVFAMDCRESFEEVIRLREQILETKATASTNIRGRRQKIFRSVQPEEATAYCATQDSTCVFVETSAKRNYHVDDLFYELFVVANLPLEMAPNHHKRVSAAFGSPCTLPPTSSQGNRAKKCTLSIKRRLSDACGVVAPNVRRPSIRTDLMIMRTKTCSKLDGDSVGGSPKLNLNRLVRSNAQILIKPVGPYIKNMKFRIIISMTNVNIM